METRYGLPIVDASNAFDVLEEFGVKRWPHWKPPQGLEIWLQEESRSDEEKAEAQRFAPRREVVFLQTPRRDLYRGFRTVATNWAMAFSLLPDDLVPVVGEFCHGAEAVYLGLPAGQPSKDDLVQQNPMALCAGREFEEETGLALNSISPLAGPEGLPVSTRKNTERYFPYCGTVDFEHSSQRTHLDETEFAKAMLVPLKEWLTLIEKGKVLGTPTVSTTYLALRRLGRLQLI